MGLEKIVIVHDVLDFFEELIYVLYEEEYFGFVESAINYVDEIISFVYQSIAGNIKKPLPKELRKFGRYYLTYTANKRTTWYIFYEFDSTENIYLVTKIINNHQPEIKFLNL